ncbi:MAG: hypothetical protein HKO71_05315 [Pseudomonadales bacterium]|nr:hypothetical protein [Pseudomonadales bacterium]
MALLLCALLASACSPLITGLDSRALDNALQLKGRSMALLDLHQGGKTYAALEERINDLIVDLRTAESYAGALPKNSTSAKQWQLVNKIVIKYWLEQWRRYNPNEKPPSGGPVFAELQRPNIASAFDALICIEVNKDYTQPLKSCGAAVRSAQAILDAIEN